MFDISIYGSQVQKLYNTVISNLKRNKLEVTIDSNINSAGVFYQDTNGDYIIKLREKSQTDFVLSHELLHIYCNIHQHKPRLISFNNSRDNFCEPFGKMITDMIEHEFIIKYQIKANINGYKNYVNSLFKSIINSNHKETATIKKDFSLLSKIFILISDLIPEYLDDPVSSYVNKIKNKFPMTYKKADILLKKYFERKYDSPFYIRKSIVEIIDAISLLSEIDISFIKYDVSVLPVVRNQQLDRAANTYIDLLKCEEKSYFASRIDRQSISGIKWNFPISQIPGRRKALSNISLRKLFAMYKINYYIDDRHGDWSYICNNI